MNFNASDVHVSHRLHLNESDSGNLYDFREVFCDEFSKISTYPDPGNTEMINAISRHYLISPDQVGFAFGAEQLIREVANTALALPFRINRFAQKMVPLILQQNDIFLKNILKTKGWIQYIESQFVSRGIQFIPSSTNFVCFRPPQGSSKYTEAAAAAGAMMRDCGLFGLPGWVRASVSSQQDADLLLSLTGRRHNEASR